MCRLVPLMAILLAYAITPGSGEITENALHLVRSGHAAHALGDEDHDPAEEHGCSGPFQVCPCHGTGAFVLSMTHIEVKKAPRQLLYVRWALTELRAEGVSTELFRPPIA